MGGMRRRLLRAWVLVVCGLIVATTAVALLSRGDLDSARDRVDVAWARLHPRLAVRYDALSAASDLAGERLGRRSELLDLLDQAVDGWRRAETARGQLEAANRLEGLAARLVATTEATPRLRSSSQMRDSLKALEASAPDDARAAYNRSVADYEDTRGGWIRRLLAGALGFDPSRSLESPVL